MIVRLEPGEVAAAHSLAALRQTVNVALGIRDKFATDDPHRLHVLGALAEFAWAKRHDQYPDLTIDPRAGTPDFITAGKRVDVKAIERRGFRERLPRGELWLMANTKKRLGEVDIYVLALIESENVVDFVGYAHEAELIDEARIRDVGHGRNCYVMLARELHTFAADAEAAS